MRIDPNFGVVWVTVGEGLVTYKCDRMGGYASRSDVEGLQEVAARLGPLNIYLLQWFFIRLQAVAAGSPLRIIKWEILRWVVPCTGWWSPYTFIGRRRN